MNQKMNQLPPWLTLRIPEIRSLCSQCHIRSLYLVGSILRPDDFRSGSDIDWVYEFDRDQIPDSAFLDNLTFFWDQLEQLTGRRADLIHYTSLKNPYFIQEIDETRLLIYDAQRQEVPV